MSDCYLCNRNLGTVPTQPNTGPPEGACAICGVFACPAHAQRDANLRKFRCGVCIPALLAASALSQAPPAQLRAEHRIRTTDQLVNTVDEFLATSPEWESVVRDQTPGLMDAAHSSFHDDLTEPLWFGLPPQAQELLAAAVAIARHLQLRPSDVPLILHELMRRWQ